MKLLVIDAQRDRCVVESHLSLAQAKVLAQLLASAIAKGAPARTGPVPEGMETAITIRPYQRGSDGACDLPPAAKWTAEPSYRSTLGEDNRPTMIMVDAENGCWSVIVKMHPDVAEKLVAELRGDVSRE